MVTPYADFSFFGILLLLLIPAIILGFLGKGLRGYSFLLNLAFFWIIYGNDHQQFISFILYVVYQWIILWIYLRYTNRTWVYRICLYLSILPLFCVKVIPLFHQDTLIGFLGISYVTFKNVQMIIEMKDRLIKEVKLFDFLDFLLFFPTISSGPIDRYRRFMKDRKDHLSGRQYGDYLSYGIHRLFQGFFYKYIIAFLIDKYWIPLHFLKDKNVNQMINQWYYYFFHYFCTLPHFKMFLSNLLYMYGYSFYLFFDFAGYTAFAIGVSYMLGVVTPENFNKPFASRNIKDFWNRWHMSLSFWFRDYVFMRVVLALTRKKILKNKQLISYIGYFSLFGLMGLWHGLVWHYIVYGIYHALLFIGYDLFERWNKKRKFWKDQLVYRLLSIFITFHFVCFGFLIFSGHLF